MKRSLGSSRLIKWSAKSVNFIQVPLEVQQRAGVTSQSTIDEQLYDSGNYQQDLIQLNKDFKKTNAEFLRAKRYAH